MNSALARYEDVFVGRQPILGPTLNTIGYEVLYRNCEIGQAVFTDESVATATVLLNAYLDIGLEHVVGSHLAFLNIPKKFILERYCEALPKKRVVLEILENVEPTPEVLEALHSLSNQGYTIALDDFVFNERFKPFLDIANIVKIDVLGKSKEQIQQEVAPLQNSHFRLLAEKVESREMYDLCKTLGFFYFQGYFFFKPDIIHCREIPTNRVALLELMYKIQDPHIPLEGLIEHIRNDLSLSYKILRYVNSAYVGLPQKVNSIDHAACMVGIDRIRTWATLIIMASDETKAHEILVVALVRAKMCEQLGHRLGSTTPEKFFTMGLLSVMDALYELPMSDIMEKLPLPEDVMEALVNGTGDMGMVLSCMKAYEEGEWMELKHLQLDPAIIRNYYLEAIDWANHFSPIIS
jgi:EAL and modified HD-GYP domain-containing signal transduction protein